MIFFSPLVTANNLTLVFHNEQGQPLEGVVVEGRTQTLSDVSQNIALIDQIDRRFVPMVRLVHTGQWVNFPNSDNVRHHVYSFSDIKQFSTPLYADEAIDPVMQTKQ